MKSFYLLKVLMVEVPTKVSPKLLNNGLLVRLSNLVVSLNATIELIYSLYEKYIRKGNNTRIHYTTITATINIAIA